MSAVWFGHLLRGFHAGEKHLACNEQQLQAPASIALTSRAFADGGLIPSQHAGRGVGDNISPQLTWSGVPANAAELVLIVEDPSAPLPRPFVHALVYGIAPSTSELAEGALSQSASRGHARGKNTFGKTMYSGPRPIRGHGSHTYVFELFALDRKLSFNTPPSRRALVQAMRGSVLAQGRLDGVYER